MRVNCFLVAQKKKRKKTFQKNGRTLETFSLLAKCPNIKLYTFGNERFWDFEFDYDWNAVLLLSVNFRFFFLFICFILFIEENSENSFSFAVNKRSAKIIIRNVRNVL